MEAIAAEQRQYCRKWVKYCHDTPPTQFINDGDKPMSCSVAPNHACDAMCPNYDHMPDDEWIEQACKEGQEMIDDYDKEHPNDLD